MKINFWSILLFILLLAGSNGYAQSTSQESASRESAFKKTIFSAPPNQESYGRLSNGGGGESPGAPDVPASIDMYEFFLLAAGAAGTIAFAGAYRKQKA